MALIAWCNHNGRKTNNPAHKIGGKNIWLHFEKVIHSDYRTIEEHAHFNKPQKYNQ